MTAQTESIPRASRGNPGRRQPIPVDATANIFLGALVTITSGVAVAAIADSDSRGVCVTPYDNTSGVDGVLGATPARYCVVEIGGEYLFVVTGSPVIGSVVKVVDDNTLTATSPGTDGVGEVTEVIGTTSWVKMYEEAR